MSSAIPLARITRNFAIASKSYITQEINFTCFCIESGESDKRNYRNRYEDLKGFIRFQLNGNDPEMACFLFDPQSDSSLQPQGFVSIAPHCVHL